MRIPFARLRGRRSGPVVSSALVLAAAFAFWPRPAGAADENPCVKCHPRIVEPAKSVHAALEMGCETCHEPVQGAPHPKQKKSMKLAKEVPALCYGCHEEKGFQGKAVHPPVADGACASCHDPHRSQVPKLLSSPVPELCVGCHDDKKANDKAVTQHAPFAAGECLDCHVQHASDLAALLTAQKKGEPKKADVKPAAAKDGKPTAAKKEDAENPVNELCFTCHDRPAFEIHPVARHPVSGKADLSRPGKDLSCVSCHDPHQSMHKRLSYKADSTMTMCVECHSKGKKPIR